MVIVNPYAKSKVSNHNGKGTPSAASGEHTSNVTRGADVATHCIGAFSNGASSNGNFSSDTTNENNPNLRNATMGCQSQFRMGSIKACKKAACGQRRRKLLDGSRNLQLRENGIFSSSSLFFFLSFPLLPRLFPPIFRIPYFC